MKVKLAKHERAILGLCEIFYRQQYTKLKHDAVRNMLYLLYRKGVHVKSYPYVCDTNGPCSAELEADLKELDSKFKEVLQKKRELDRLMEEKGLVSSDNDLVSENDTLDFD